MNKEWSELNKTMQAQLKKKDTFDEGIATLFELRKSLWNTISSYKKELKREDFDSIPYINADGYHSKTIAYSLWHIFRIEDIVAHTLIKGDEQVFFAKGYQERSVRRLSPQVMNWSKRRSLIFRASSISMRSILIFMT